MLQYQTQADSASEEFTSTSHPDSLPIRTMKKFILIAVLAVIGWQGYAKYQGKSIAFAGTPEAHGLGAPAQVAQGPAPLFKCDGRTYCSQMTSCDEATFFLKNCPGVKMDGNNDGIPCEKQWCK